jgi:glycosyltransferase involved in cell wall biosynthesis
MGNGVSFAETQDVPYFTGPHCKMSTLTIAVPNYNGAGYLSDTLRSINQQELGVNWFLQDGASQDDSVRIAEKLRRCGDVVVSEPDRGQTDALNRAFARMGGDIIGFLNSDDILVPGAAAAIVGAFKEDPSLDLVYGEVEWIDEQGRVTGHHTGRIESLEEVLDIYRVWWQRRQWVQPEVFFRRSLWERVGAFNESYDLAFDYDYWVRCFLAGAKVRRIPRVLAQFRIHDGQKSKRAQEAANEIRDIVHRTLALDPPIPEAVKRRISRTLSYDRYHNNQGDFQGARPSFGKSLLQHPEWLVVPAVQSRLVKSLTSRLQCLLG